MADGTLKVGTITTSSGSGTITIGQSGETVNIPSGCTITNSGTQTGFGGVNTPAFAAYNTGDYTMSDATYTTSQINTEFFDTASAFDTSTYKFTPQTAGKYYFYGSFRGGHSDNNCINNARIRLRKNGSSTIAQTLFSSDVSSSNPKGYNMSISGAIELNGSTDYVTLETYLDMVGQTPSVYDAYFGGYKIIE